MKNCFDIIDFVLSEMKDKGSYYYSNINPSYTNSESIEAFSLMKEYGLINILDKSEKYPKYSITLTTKGHCVISNHKNFKEFYDLDLANKKEFMKVSEKLNIKNLELVENTINDFPNTKRRANIGLGIAIGLAVLELVKWIIQLNSNPE